MAKAHLDAHKKTVILTKENSHMLYRLFLAISIRALKITQKPECARSRKMSDKLKSSHIVLQYYTTTKGDKSFVI